MGVNSLFYATNIPHQATSKVDEQGTVRGVILFIVGGFFKLSLINQY